MPCAFQLNVPRQYVDIVRGTQFFDGGALGSCQFEVPEDKLIAFAGNVWCPFHLPVKDDEGRLSVKARWESGESTCFEQHLSELIEKAITESSKLNLSGVVFPTTLTFSMILKGEKAFHNTLLFCDTQFLGVEYFSRNNFGMSVCFDRSTFWDKAYFINTRFGGEASFDHVNFKNDVMFEGATVSGGILFSNTVFYGQSNFKSFVFTNKALFSEAKFVGETDFSGSELFQGIDFSKSQFRANVRFTNRSFADKTNFGEVVFAIAPEFYAATLHQDTNFAGAKFDDTESEGAARAYRSLKVAMEIVRARNEEAMFYALEQKSLRRRKDTPRLVKLFSFLYEITSNYGRSLLLPLIWLFVAFFAANFTYAHIAVLYGPPVPIDALSLAVEQLIRPFSIWTADYADRHWIMMSLVQQPLLLRSIATVQSILCLSSITLFLLVLRWRFKRG